MKGDLIAVLQDIKTELNGIRVELVRIQEAIEDTNPTLSKLYENKLIDKEANEERKRCLELYKIYKEKQLLATHKSLEEERPHFDSDNIPDIPQEPKIQLEK